MNVRLFFHYVSYLQYLLILIAMFFIGKGYLVLFQDDDIDQMLNHVNSGLIFMGISLSFSSLQDPTKTQNKFSRKIYENPRKGRVFIGIISVMASIFIISGLIGYLSFSNQKISDISFGILTLGIGFIGILKVAIEMFENHRLDKKSKANLGIVVESK